MLSLTLRPSFASMDRRKALMAMHSSVDFVIGFFVLGVYLDFFVFLGVYLDFFVFLGGIFVFNGV